jgi:hypothetical protein
MTMDADQILNKQLDAARAVDFSPSITTTNLEHLEPIKSSSSASSSEKSISKQENTQSDDNGAERKSLESGEPKNEENQLDLKTTRPEIKGEESGRPFKQNAAIIVHKIPIHSIVLARI